MRKALKAVDREAYYDERTLLWDQEHDRSAKAVKELFGRMGGLYNKLAQDFATRDGLLPQPWVDALKGSFETLKPRPWTKMRACIFSGLADEGRSPIDPTKPRGSLERYFKDITPKPLAAASIGQVHVARRYRLRDDETAEDDDDDRVVVKVIYPDIRRHLLADLANARRAAHIITYVLKLPMKGSVDAIMDEQCASFPNEVDLRLERDNVATARELFTRHGLDVVIPVVYDELSSSSVLSESFLQGRTLSSMDATELSRADRDRSVAAVAEVARAIGVTMFREGFFHSDPHPGNIMLLDSGRPALIDWGQCTRLADPQLKTLCQIVLLLHTKSPSLIERALHSSDINFNTDNSEFKLALLYYFFDSSRDLSDVVRPQATEFLMDAIQHNPNKMPVMTDVPREVVFYGRVCGTLRKSFDILGSDVSVIDLWHAEARAALKRINATQPDLTSAGLLLLPDNPQGLAYVLDRSPDWISGALRVVNALGSRASRVARAPPPHSQPDKGQASDTTTQTILVDWSRRRRWTRVGLALVSMVLLL